MDTPRVPQGALIVPGRYIVKLTVDGVTRSQPLRIFMDPRVSVAQSALERQYAMAHDVATLLDRTYDARTSALARKDAKDAAAFSRINGGLSFLIDMIEGADAPVPQGTTQAYCTQRSQALAALGTSATRNPFCP
jgi:hypothetical protein